MRINVLKLSGLLVLFLSIFPFNLVAQQQLVDSLKSELTNAMHPDTTLIDLMVEISARTYRGAPDSARYYARSAVELANQHHYPKGLAEGYKYWGASYFVQGKMDTAALYYKKALTIHEENNDIRGIASSQAGLGTTYAVNNQFQEAIKYFLASTQTFEELENFSAIAVMYNNIANLYLEQELFDEAYHNYLRALEALENTANKKQAPLIYLNVANVLSQLKRLEEALEHVNMGIALAKEFNDTRAMAGLELTAGNIYRDFGEFETALSRYAEAQRMYSQLGIHSQLAEIGYSIALLETEQGRKSQARQTLLSIIDDFKLRDISLPRLESNTYELLAQLESEYGNSNQAVKYALKSKTISDSLYKQEHSIAIADLQTKYETEKKEQEIQLLEAEAETTRIRIIFGVVIVTGFILAISILIWLRIRQQARERLLEMESVQRELSNYGHLIVEKDNFITNVVERLQALGKYFKTIESKKALNSMLTDLQQNVDLTENEDQLFKRIDQVNTGFFKKLEHRAGSMTKNEKRLSSLVQMNLSNKEIAGILQISTRSVVQARYRLKKKLDLDSDTKLTDYLIQLGN